MKISMSSFAAPSLTLNRKGLPIDRTNGFVYYGGVFVANSTGGLELQNFDGVSGGAVQLTLFGTIPSSSTTTPGGINQAFLVKYKI